MSVPTVTPASLGAPERIERTLTREILRGDHRPGTHLAPLRELARRFDVNPSTMQRALARIEAKGLVVARQGSGLTVQDPLDAADLSLLPDWLAAVTDDPERSATLLDELLEARRLLAARLMATRRLDVLDALGDLAAGASSLADLPPEQVMATDLAVARAVVRAAGSTIGHAVLNSFERAVEALPLLATAMYGEPARNARSMRRVLEALRDGGADVERAVLDAFESVDRVTVRRYAALLAGSPA